MVIGQRADSVSGIYDYNAPYYDPATGRFIQPDRIVPQPYNPQDWDRYRYVRNNPLVYSDPTGHNPLLLIAALVVGTIVLTGDTPLIMPSLPLSNDQAATLGDLLLMGINHVTNANLVGEGLQDLQNDPHIKGAQIDILNDI